MAEKQFQLLMNLLKKSADGKNTLQFPGVRMGDSHREKVLVVKSLTIVVCLVDSSLISFLLKLLQRGLTSI